MKKAINLTFILLFLVGCVSSPTVIKHGKWNYVFYGSYGSVADAYNKIHPKAVKRNRLSGFADCNNRTIHTVWDFDSLTHEVTHCLDRNWICPSGNYNIEKRKWEKQNETK